MSGSTEDAARRFFAAATAPADLTVKRAAMQQFVQTQLRRRRGVVLVTSGGTTVPLERATVRFIDNFSVGTRGAISAEHFIQLGYAVVFLHRQYSLQPYHRHFSHAERGLLDHLMLDERSQRVSVLPRDREDIAAVLKQYEAVVKDQALLPVTFVTVSEYLFLLRDAAMAMRPLGPAAVLYLAAAVSDFYLPEDKMSEHKIQSGDGGLRLDLDQVPKTLHLLKAAWAPQAYVISFKLETDPSLLLKKSRQSLERYKHQLVIGNMLATRKRLVTLSHASGAVEDIVLTDEELHKHPDAHIEARLIARVVQLHREYTKQTAKL